MMCFVYKNFMKYGNMIFYNINTIINTDSDIFVFTKSFIIIAYKLNITF